MSNEHAAKPFIIICGSMGDIKPARLCPYATCDIYCTWKIEIERDCKGCSYKAEYEIRKEIERSEDEH